MDALNFITLIIIFFYFSFISSSLFVWCRKTKWNEINGCFPNLLTILIKQISRVNRLTPPFLGILLVHHLRFVFGLSNKILSRKISLDYLLRVLWLSDNILQKLFKLKLNSLVDPLRFTNKKIIIKLFNSSIVSKVLNKVVTCFFPLFN